MRIGFEVREGRVSVRGIEVGDGWKMAWASSCLRPVGEGVWLRWSGMH